MPRVLPLPFCNFAHYCAAFLNAPMSDRDKKKRCLPWVTFPGKSLSFVIDARINGIYAYRLTGVIMIPHWIGCCEKVRKVLIHESSVTTKCRVCSQCNEITKEERGTKIIQHLNSTYNSALSLLHHTPDGNIFIKKMIMKHIVQKLLQCFLAFKFGIIWNVYLWTYMCYETIRQQNKAGTQNFFLQKKSSKNLLLTGFRKTHFF